MASDFSGASSVGSKRRAVFSDVDGTLVDAAHHPMAEDASVFDLLRQRGVPFCLVSARSPEGLYPIQKALDFTGPIASYSGAYVLDEQGRGSIASPSPWMTPWPTACWS